MKIRILKVPKWHNDMVSQEAERAKAAFEALSPEEQAAVMQQVAAQGQGAEMASQPTEEEMMAAEQGGADTGIESQPMDEGMMQQQMMPQAMEEGAMMGGTPMMACGGKVNRYDDGGKVKKALYKLMGWNTDSDFYNWANKNKLKGVETWGGEGDASAVNAGDKDWLELINDATFKAALKDNPAFADAISKGYDFGSYVPGANGNVTFDNDRGNWDMQTVQGWWGSQDPAWLEVIKNHPTLTKDTKLDKKTLESYLSSTDAFKRGTEWLKASPENRLTYLQAILKNPNAPVRARQYAERFIDANGWKQGAATDYDTIFNNPSGRAANPGTYWKTPIEAVRGAQVKNLVQNADGNWEEVIGEVPTDWTSAGNYSWATPENDVTYNYFRRPDAAVIPAEAAAGTVNAEEGADGDAGNNGYAPKHRWEALRYAGLFGPAVGLGMQALGVGRPDTRGLDAVVSSASQPAHLARYKPIGNYLRYRPMDIWFEQNRMDANARATDRAIQNNAAPVGTKIAGMLANEYNSQIADGELYRKALEYNDNLRKQVAEFNRGTDQFNAEAFNRTSQFNADAMNRARQYNAQLAMQAAQQKMAADAGWYNSLYGNVSGLFKGLSDVGRENAQHNMIADMAANGIFGTLTPDSYIAKKYLKNKKNGNGTV